MKAKQFAGDLSREREAMCRALLTFGREERFEDGFEMREIL
jgi:hypothetical protein